MTPALVELEMCAQAAHEMNRVYCMALGDDSQPPWEAAPDWQRNSARDGVLGVLQGNTPEQSHVSWLESKRADGWRYGPRKDPVAKTHPCFLPYEDLTPAQRAKDDLFVGAVRLMARALGMEVH